MQSFEGPVDALIALQNLLVASPSVLDSEPLSALRTLSQERSSVVGTVRAVELVYAHKEADGDVPDDLVEWAAAAAVMQEDHGFHGMEHASRGSKIAKLLRGKGITGERPAPAPDAIPQTPPDIVPPAGDGDAAADGAEA